MKKIIFLLATLFMVSCSQDNTMDGNSQNVQDVLNVIKGHRLTQGNFALWYEYKNNDSIVFRDNASNEYTYDVSESRGVSVSEGDANQGVRAYFSGTDADGNEIESYITLLDEYNQKWGIHITTFLNGSELTDQLFELP